MTSETTYSKYGEWFNDSDLDAFTEAYIECALWSSPYGANGEHCLDDGEHELAAETVVQMRKDCIVMLTRIVDAFKCIPTYNPTVYDDFTLLGHDFWLTRNHHGAGYWDGDLPEDIGQRLTGLADAFGECNLYVGDDGEVYSA